LAETRRPPLGGWWCARTRWLAEERTRKRAELLAATEQELIRIQARVQRASKKLRGAAAIGQAVGAVLGRRKMAKHFQISISDDTFGFARNHATIAASEQHSGQSREIFKMGLAVGPRIYPCDHAQAPSLHGLRFAKADRPGVGPYPCRKRRSASRVSCSACLVTRALVAR
jgi:hypothetical protein